MASRPTGARQARRTQHAVASASALAPRGGAKTLASKLWGFSCRYDPSEDLALAEKGARRAAERAEAREMKREEAHSQDLRRRELKADYYELVRLVHRFGACPGHVYCSSAKPGHAYARHLAEHATTLAQWWRRIRSRAPARAPSA